MMREPNKLATIVCPVCSVSIEIFQHRNSGRKTVEWNPRDAEYCKNPPLRQCQEARTAIKREFLNESV